MIGLLFFVLAILVSPFKSKNLAQVRRAEPAGVAKPQEGKSQSDIQEFGSG